MVNRPVQIEVVGTDEVSRKLHKLNRSARASISKAINDAVFFVEGEVKASIVGQRSEPRSFDTGRFLRSVSSIRPDDFTAVVESNVNYAPFLEYGTTRMLPRRHFRNTITRNKTKVIDFVQGAVYDVVGGF